MNVPSQKSFRKSLLEIAENYTSAERIVFDFSEREPSFYLESADEQVSELMTTSETAAEAPSKPQHMCKKGSLNGCCLLDGHTSSGACIVSQNVYLDSNSEKKDLVQTGIYIYSHWMFYVWRYAYVNRMQPLGFDLLLQLVKAAASLRGI
jgi:hypothetical protein